jgi:hypothetical protein
VAQTEPVGIGSAIAECVEHALLGGIDLRFVEKDDWVTGMGIYEGSPAPAAQAHSTGRPRTGRGSSPVPIGVAAGADIVGLTCLGALAIHPGIHLATSAF